MCGVGQKCYINFKLETSNCSRCLESTWGVQRDIMRGFELAGYIMYNQSTQLWVTQLSYCESEWAGVEPSVDCGGLCRAVQGSLMVATVFPSNVTLACVCGPGIPHVVANKKQVSLTQVIHFRVKTWFKVKVS